MISWEFGPRKLFFFHVKSLEFVGYKKVWWWHKLIILLKIAITTFPKNYALFFVKTPMKTMYCFQLDHPSILIISYPIP